MRNVVTSYRLLAALIVLTLLGAAVFLVTAPDPRTHVTAYFARASGIHVDDDVRVLGVRVGSVEEIQPEGTRVRVRFGYDARRKVPESATVALVAPTLVSGRYLQLTPVYRGGPLLADGAEIPQSRTAEPEEWDQINGELTKLSEALGPNGANREGAVSRLVNTGAANLGGNGQQFSQMLHQLAAASSTLAGGSGDLFSTVRNLDDFTTALNASQDRLKSFATQLSSISGLASDTRTQLAGAMTAADRALTTITGFVDRDKETMGTTVGSLADVAKTLSRSRNDLANILHLAPQTMANLYNIYEPVTGAANSRTVTPNTESLSTLVCQAIFSVGGTIDSCRGALAPVLGRLDSPPPPVGQSGPPQGGGR